MDKGKCRIAYDYVARGSTYHGEFPSATKKPQDGSKIDVTYLPDQPAASIPFAKRELDASDLAKTRDDERLGAIAISCGFLCVIGIFLNIFLLETRLSRDGKLAMGPAKCSGRCGMRTNTHTGTIEQTEIWIAIGGMPGRNSVLPVAYRRKGERFESRIADNLIFRDPPTTFG